MADTAVNGREVRTRLETPEEYVGYEVHDPEGQRIGSVKELFANAYGEPEYVRVKIGFFRMKYVLIPLSFVSVDEKRQILTLH